MAGYVVKKGVKGKTFGVPKLGGHYLEKENVYGSALKNKLITLPDNQIVNTKLGFPIYHCIS